MERSEFREFLEWANGELYLDHEFTPEEIESVLNHYEMAPTAFEGYDDETPNPNDPHLGFKDWR